MRLATVDCRYRVELTAADLTPYAVVQAQSFWTTAYGETTTSGSLCRRWPAMQDRGAKPIGMARIIQSVKGALSKIQFDIERDQSVEQRHLAIVVPRCESAVGDLFAAVLKQSKPQQRTQDSRLHGAG